MKPKRKENGPPSRLSARARCRGYGSTPVPCARQQHHTTTSALCAASGAFLRLFGTPGYVATSTAPGERYEGENGAVQPRITPSNAPSTPQQPGRSPGGACTAHVAPRAPSATKARRTALQPACQLSQAAIAPHCAARVSPSRPRKPGRQRVDRRAPRAGRMLPCGVGFNGARVASTPPSPWA